MAANGPLDRSPHSVAFACRIDGGRAVRDAVSGGGGRSRLIEGFATVVEDQ